MQAELGAVATEQHDFSQVYAQYFDHVWTFMRRLGVPTPLLDDAVQDVFVVCHRRLHEFEGRSTVRTWLFGIARRVAFRYHRKEARAAQKHAALSREFSQHREHPDEGLSRVEASALLDEFLSTLDDDKREVFVLAELESYSRTQLGQALGISPGTAYNRLRAARRKFEATFRNSPWQGQIRARATSREAAPEGARERTWAAILPIIGLPGGAEAAGTSALLGDGGLGAGAATEGAAVVNGGAVGTASSWGGLGPVVAKVVAATALVGGAGYLTLGGLDHDFGASTAADGSEIAALDQGERGGRVSAVPMAPEETVGSETLSAAGSPHAAVDTAAVPTSTIADAGPRTSPAVDAKPRTRRPARPGPKRATASEKPPVKALELAEDERMLERAQRLLGTPRDAERVLALLERHEQRFPDSPFAQERQSFRIEALCHMGQASRARSEAATLQRAYPNATLGPELLDSCSNAPGAEGERGG